MRIRPHSGPVANDDPGDRIGYLRHPAHREGDRAARRAVPGADFYGDRTGQGAAADASIQAATFANRFAAKEAAAKALGTGFRRGVFFSDLGVVNLPGGQPTLAMTGGSAERGRPRRRA